MNLQILGDIPNDAQLAVRGDLPGKRATLFYVEDSAIRGVIAINTPRDLNVVTGIDPGLYSQLLL